MEQADYIVCECALEPLAEFVRGLEQEYAVTVVRQPAVCMTMVQTEDSVEGQPFYLGEALTTECELQVDGQAGLGLCLGDEPLRCYCIAFVDAVLLLADRNLERVEAFLEQQGTAIARQQQVEYNHIQRTKVDFKLLEND
ncbi:MAG TPA: phosphonate C-P lyase system protein PhnG [Puia sp.]|jgi:alpha-D-ribose 1-methylphosphonate 5-triphosphate synthase subunit PhnG|nr:phosphonate C-P lyase system protein PhnG [Puia sp.]